MILILATIFFIFGLIIGSFLNVAIYRYHTSKSFGGRSACMSCRNQLRFYELVPVFSFLFLRGRCRNCKSKISFQYILVELATGLIFSALFLKFQDLFFISNLAFITAYAYYAVMFSLLVMIATYDLKHKIIPDALSLLFGTLAFAGLFFFSGNNIYSGYYFHMPGLWDFLSGILIALPFAFFWLVSKGAWMGLGDAKLAVGLGWFLGLSMAISGIVVAFWVGAIVGIFLLLLSKKYGMKSEIPFAPFLVLGAVLAFIFELHLFPFFS